MVTNICRPFINRFQTLSIIEDKIDKVLSQGQTRLGGLEIQRLALELPFFHRLMPMVGLLKFQVVDSLRICALNERSTSATDVSVSDVRSFTFFRSSGRRRSNHAPREGDNRLGDFSRVQTF